MTALSGSPFSLGNAVGNLFSKVLGRVFLQFLVLGRRVDSLRHVLGLLDHVPDLFCCLDCQSIEQYGVGCVFVGIYKRTVGFEGGASKARVVATRWIPRRQKGCLHNFAANVVDSNDSDTLL